MTYANFQGALLNAVGFEPHLVRNNAANKKRYKSRTFIAYHGAEAEARRLTYVPQGGDSQRVNENVDLDETRHKYIEVQTSLRRASFQHVVLHTANMAHAETTGSGGTMFSQIPQFR